MPPLKGKKTQGLAAPGESPEDEDILPPICTEDEEVPAPGKIKEKIMRRVYETIDTCSDPKKLMDVYETLSKLETDTDPRETIFDVIQAKLKKRTN